MTRSLVIGVNGQDGSYLAEILLRRGYEVVGCGRDDFARHVQPAENFTYEKIDLRDLASFEALVHRVAPDLIFHVAAVHGASGFEYEEIWRDMMNVNVLSLHVLLEYARHRSDPVRIIYAGSAKTFPTPLAGKINEMSPMRATCLYSIGKIASGDLIMQYREKHGVAATNLILFNHESSRRPSSYFLPTIARSIIFAKADPSYRARVKTLSFRIDWSAAEELMDIAVDIAERSDIGEVILASGITWYGRTAVENLFAHYNLDMREHVVEEFPHSDPGPEFCVDIGRLVKVVGRGPMKSLQDIVAEMVDDHSRIWLAQPRRA
jgi:GDPmannose 4,6-dehydratase